MESPPQADGVLKTIIKKEIFSPDKDIRGHPNRKIASPFLSDIYLKGLNHALLCNFKFVIIAPMPTQRQNIMDLLSRGTFTLQDLSAELHMSVKEILLHLPHVQKSVRPPNKFIIEPARCLNCGYIFRDRTKLHSPSKCPRCRESHIQEPAYYIE